MSAQQPTNMGLSLAGVRAIYGIPAEAHNSAYKYMKPEARKWAMPRNPSATYRTPKTKYRYRSHEGASLPVEDCTCSISEDCMHKPKGQLDCRSLAPTPKETRHMLTFRSGQHVDTNIRKYHNELVRTIKYFEVLSQDLRTNNITPLPLLQKYVRDWISHMKCFSMTRSLLEESNILSVLEDFFRWMIDNDKSYRTVPLTIRYDLEWLKRKWRKGDWDLTDSLRGIHVDRWHLGRSIDRKWKFYKRNWRRFGNNGLIPGETWPHQIAIMRDGGHGAPEAGISGIRGEGATSLILSDPERREDYADIDKGDRVKYVSTANTTPTPTYCTGLLIASYEWHVLREKIKGECEDEKLEEKEKRRVNGRPVRLFRSWRLSEKNKWRPRSGFRYDGLYDVTDSELIDPDRALYRFTLERQEGQGEIRVDQPDEQMCRLYYQTGGVQKAAKRKLPFD